MLSPASETPIHPLLPDSLLQLSSSRAPKEKLGLAMIAIPTELNGREREEAELWLTGEELSQLDHYTFTKRKGEWLSGRICAKQATINLLKNYGTLKIPHARDFSIAASQSGRPFLNLDRLPVNDKTIDISISHSHNMAVGLAGHGRCGIDIQYLSETLFKVRHRFCADIEAVILDQIAADELTQLGLLWVAKEAIRKCLSKTRIVGFRELTLAGVAVDQGHYILQFHPKLDGFSFPQSNPLPVITHHDDSFAISVCTAEEENNHAGTS